MFAHNQQTTKVDQVIFQIFTNDSHIPKCNNSNLLYSQLCVDCYAQIGTTITSHKPLPQHIQTRTLVKTGMIHLNTYYRMKCDICHDRLTVSLLLNSPHTPLPSFFFNNKLFYRFLLNMNLHNRLMSQILKFKFFKSIDTQLFWNVRKKIFFFRSYLEKIVTLIT